MFQIDLNASGDTVLFPAGNDMEQYTGVTQIEIVLEPVGDFYGLCNLAIHGCASKLSNDGLVFLFLVLIFDLIQCTFANDSSSCFKFE